MRPIATLTGAALVLACASTASALPAEPKIIEITASRFEFQPAEIQVTEGDTVRLKARSADGAHGIAIKAFKVKLSIPKTGETVSVDFVADKAGSYPFTCSEYCGAGHSRMKGTLVVKRKAAAQ